MFVIMQISFFHYLAGITRNAQIPATFPFILVLVLILQHIKQVIDFVVLGGN